MKVAAFVVGLLGSLYALNIASTAIGNAALAGQLLRDNGMSTQDIPQLLVWQSVLSMTAGIGGIIGIVGSALVMGGRASGWKVLLVACPLALGGGIVSIVMIGLAAFFARSEARRMGNPVQPVSDPPTP